MNYRDLGRTGFKVSEISFGAWAIGNDWGTVDDKESIAALHRAVDLGVNFFDTADVYSDGRSEKLLAQLKRDRREEIIIATKAGRRLNPHVAGGYTGENLTNFIERSLQNLETDALDLVQLHCPPTDVYYFPELSGALDNLIEQGKIKNYGVSVEKVEEAMKAIEFPNVKTVQIIFNIFRQRPADLFFDLAKRKNVGILARLPLSSGMLTGKMKSDTKFEAQDHRNYNRHGAAFDVGETFSGVDYKAGLQAVDELRGLVPENMTMAQFALRWILMFDAVTCAIPGAKRPAQAEDNIAAADLPPISDETMRAVRKFTKRGFVRWFIIAGEICSKLMPILKWGLIGAGDIARKRIAPALRDLPNCDLTAVCRNRAELAESFAAEFEARKWFADWRDLIADEEVEAVYIATPVYLHEEQTIAAAEAGKHVLCEKPMAINVAECDEMIAACRANNVKLGVAYYRHFYPVIERVKQIIKTGEIGKAVFAHINAFEFFDPSADNSRRWLIEKEKWAADR